MKFVDLFAGLGGFHLALTSQGHECVFASELDEELRSLYVRNFPHMDGRMFGDIRKHKDSVPPHDILCAGFPCQPFSKSGEQLGSRDETRGTLFHEILDVLATHRPRFFILENVGNFERHDGGNTWRVVKRQLVALGYQVCGTEHVTPLPKRDWRDGSPLPTRRGKRKSGKATAESQPGHGLVSPHHLGYPQTRERFFVVGSLDALPAEPFPPAKRRAEASVKAIVQVTGELQSDDKLETALTAQQVACINHWNKLLASLPASIELPSFPIWGDELEATYPFESSTPWRCSTTRLRAALSPKAFPPYTRKAAMLASLPSYAREERDQFSDWKVRYIRQNREWFTSIRKYIPEGWTERLRAFPASLRKLEWNAKGEERDLWKLILQFRPSGLRAKRYTTSPALVAMTTTQIPLLGPERRFLTRVEGLRLQGFPDGHHLPRARAAAFGALGNAVHVHVVAAIATRLLPPGAVGVATQSGARSKRAA